jgi:hypothetical protein
MVQSWYDRGIRLDEVEGSVDIFAPPAETPEQKQARRILREPKAKCRVRLTDSSCAAFCQVRETVEEAWAAAPEGSFLSPSLAMGIFAVGLTIRYFVFGPQGPQFF